MKLSKKILAALSTAALLATSAVFTSCGEDDDDDYGIISKDNSDSFTINFTNEDASIVKRGYKTTKTAHSGALVQITLNKSDNGSGAVGYIWDLEAAKSDGTYSRAVKDTRRFCIAALSYRNGKIRPYVSMYKDVEDIEVNNFGVSTTGTNATAKKEETDAEAKGSATETEYLKLSDSATYNINENEVDANADGNFVITIDVYEDGEFTWNEAKTKRVYTSYNGGYKVDVYNGAVSVAEIAEGSKTPVSGATAIIPATDLGYLAKKTDALATGATLDPTKPVVEQQTCAVYANVYGGQTMTAKVEYASTYKEDEVVEE